MNMIHQSFLDDIHNQQHKRLENYAQYDNYFYGEQDVGIPKKVKAALESELGTVVNYCPLVVNSTVDYIMGGGVNLEAVDNEEAEEALLGVYEANGLLTEEMIKTITIQGKKGDVFTKTYIDKSDQVQVRILRPDIVFPRYRTDDYTEMIYCAVKWFADGSEFDIDDGGMWKAQVFTADMVKFYELQGNDDTESTTWILTKEEENKLGFIPIIHIKNTIDDLEFGVSDLLVMLDLQDALNKTVTDMLLTMDNQAFQRLFVFGSQSPPGHEISQEPGAIVENTNEMGSVTAIEPASIDGFLEGMREIIDQITTVTQIAKVTTTKSGGMIPESGYAARMAYIPLEMKADRKVAILQRRFAELNQMIFRALALTGAPDYTGTKTKLHFKSGLPVDEVAQMEVHEKELVNKIKSRETVMQERGIKDTDLELARIEVDDIEPAT